MKHLLSLSSLLYFAATLPAADWLHWRGPTQNGVSTDTGLPDTWSPKGENLIWKQPHGGRSTPVVSKGRVYIINNVDEGTTREQERVMCFDAKKGDLLWEHRFNVFLCDIVSSRVGWSNPVADAETGNVYVHGVQGLFFCFSPEGKVLWSRSFTEEYGRITGYGGRVPSPIVDGELVFIHFLNSSWGNQGPGGHRFLAMNKRTGEVVWWTEPGGAPLDTIYSVPVVAHIGNQRLLICGTADGGICALQAHTGKKVWHTVFSKRGTNASPVVEGSLVYITNGEDNIDSSEKGTVVCLDGAQVTNGKPKVVWRRDGLEVGYASPILHDGRLYLCDNSAKMWCLDAKTGRDLWDRRFSYGTVAKASPVMADGKIYVPEVSGKFHIIEPRENSAKSLHTQRFGRPDGTVVEINGSVAISDGRIYLVTRDDMYCIGTANSKNGVVKGIENPSKLGEPAQVQVLPADAVLAPGESMTFSVRVFDADGNLLNVSSKPEWSLPEPPPPPTAPQNKPPALKGVIDETGKLTAAKEVPAQAALVQAKVGNLIGRARVRVAPQLPINQDFEKAVIGSIPGGWINLGGKFVVEKKEDGNILKKRADNPRLARAYAYIGMPTLRDYTIECDLQGAKAGAYFPEMGLVNTRYTFVLDGNKNRLSLRTWDANIKIGPSGEITSFGRLDKSMSFDWKPNVWYRFKFKVEVKGDKAVCQGKIWPRDDKEPDSWTLEIEDPVPNPEGSPALYAYAHGISDTTTGTEIFIDNVKVTPNKK